MSGPICRIRTAIEGIDRFPDNALAEKPQDRRRQCPITLARFDLSKAARLADAPTASAGIDRPDLGSGRVPEGAEKTAATIDSS